AVEIDGGVVVGFDVEVDAVGEKFGREIVEAGVDDELIVACAAVEDGAEGQGGVDDHFIVGAVAEEIDVIEVAEDDEDAVEDEIALNEGDGIILDGGEEDAEGIVAGVTIDGEAAGGNGAAVG